MGKRPKLRLSETEEDILKVLWAAAKPLSVTEICDHAESIDIVLYQSTVQASVNKLVKKGLIGVDGLTQNFKAIARVFSPTISRTDFVLLQLNQIMDVFGDEDKDARLAAFIIDNKLAGQSDDLSVAAAEGRCGEE